MQRLGRFSIGIMTAAALTWQVGTAAAQTAEPARAAPLVAADTSRGDWRPIVAGLGAIAGVVVFNVAALGVQALPGGLGYAAGATVPAEMSVAMSRVYATTSAVVGAWIGYYLVSR